MSNVIKNIEVSRLFRVAPTTVTNWIEYASQGKNDLKVAELGKKILILDTLSNRRILKKLAEEAQKYKSKSSFKEIEPKTELYKIFMEDQVIDIITNIEMYKEIPHKYVYFNGGAEAWNQYVKAVLKSDEPITIKDTIKALRFDQEYIYSLVKKYPKINVIDIGPGNAEPVKELLSFLHSKGILRKYIGIDYSPEILNITEENLKSWFGNKFLIETHIRDITANSFKELVFKNTYLSGNDDVDCINLVLFLGSTIENQRQYDQSLNIIKNSIGSEDIFVLGQLLDTEQAKLELSFISEDNTNNDNDIDLEKNVLRMLGIKDEYYSVERLFDEVEHARIIQIRLNVDIKIKINTPSLKKNLNLKNKDKIIVFRHNHHKTFEIISDMNQIGFDLLHTNITPEQDHILAIFKVRTITV